MKYQVTAQFAIEAASAEDAQEIAAVCLQYWGEEHGLDKLQGVAGAEGYVRIEAKS